MRYEIVVYGYYVKWYKDAKFHRLYGPAVEYSDGSREWLKNDKWHRLHGPAWEWANGIKKWYIDDNQYTEKEFKNRVKYEI